MAVGRGLTVKMFIYQGFISVLNKSQILTIRVRSASWAQWPPVDFPGRHLKNTRISNGFQGGACWIQWGSRGPLPTGEELAQGLTVKMFILAMCYKGFSIRVRF